LPAENPHRKEAVEGPKRSLPRLPIERVKIKYAAAALVLLALGVSATMFTEPPPDPGGRDRKLGLPLHPEGSFHASGPAKDLPWSGVHARLDESDSASSDPLVGTLRSSPFLAPAMLKFYVSGYPSAPGMRMYLQDIANGRTLDLVNGIDPGPMWRLRQWKIPSAWRETAVILVVRDGGSGPVQWVGITEPHSGGRPLPASIAKALHRTSLLILLSLAFLLPGFAIVLAAAKLGVSLNLARAMSMILGGSAFIAYAVFWIYLSGRAAGDAASWTVLSASFIAIALLLWNTPLRPALGARVLQCLGTVLLVAVFYNSLGFIHEEDSDLGQIAQNRYLPKVLPPDNVLQELFAERIYDTDAGGKPLTEPLIAYWHTSDRPPLETAITLLVMPFAQKTTRDLHYQLLGIFLQCTWIAGLWTLLHAVGIRGRYIASAIAFGVVSDFCLVHSFYVWPKLFAAAFCLLGLSFFPWTRRRARWNALDVSLAGFMFGFALLTHSGVVLTVAPAVAILYRKLPRLRMAAWGAASLLLLQLPWMAYQKWCDPPGDNLLKLHLAGSEDLQQPLWQSVRMAYSHLTVQQYVWNKLANVGALFGGRICSGLLADDWRTTLDAFLGSTFYYLLFTLGLLCAGLLVRLLGGPHKASRAWSVADRFFAVAAGALVFWCVILFEPGTTIVHQGSFATVLLLFVSCVLYLVEFMPVLFWILLAIQVCVLFPLFVFGKGLLVMTGGVLDNALDPGMTLTAFACFALLIFFYRRSQVSHEKAI
jgi:hypothetical protein